MGAALGTPFMPWQRQVADVACELDPADTRRWRYPVVVVTVPRQSGKTTLVRAVTVHRAVTRPGARIFATAQRGKDARARWFDLVERVEHSPLASAVTVLRGTGSEACKFPNGSRISPFAPVPSALHGETPPLVVIDEGWAFDAAQGEALEAAIRPAQITLPDRQLWIISTAGTAESTWLRGWVDRGRAAVDDPSSGVAYFEWSADEDADPYAPDTLDFHPAVGHTITRDDILAEADQTSPGNYQRGYLNLWTVSTETILDLDLLDDLTADLAKPDPSTVALAYDVAQDRSGASIFAAWPLPDGTVAYRLVVSKPGTTWLVPEVIALRAKLKPRAIAADDGGPARQATDELRRRGVPVDTLTFRDFATATGLWISSVKDRTMLHDGSPELRDAVERASLKRVGDQLAFDRRKSSGPVDAAISATVAGWAATHAPAPAPRPFLYFGTPDAEA